LVGLVGVLLILVRGGVSKEGKGTVFATLEFSAEDFRAPPW
jgi:hypothetical protein